jgi:hypothetical protein
MIILPFQGNGYVPLRSSFNNASRPSIVSFKAITGSNADNEADDPVVANLVGENMLNIRDILLVALPFRSETIAKGKKSRPRCLRRHVLQTMHKFRSKIF